MRLESGEGVELLCRWRLGFGAGWRRGRLESGEGGRGARIWSRRRDWLENGDGGGDGDSLRFYVAIIVPQMPLSKIDGMVNLISTRRAKERHLIVGACWQDCSERYEIKFLGHVGGTARRGAQQRLKFIPCCNRK